MKTSITNACAIALLLCCAEHLEAKRLVKRKRRLKRGDRKSRHLMPLSTDTKEPSSTSTKVPTKIPNKSTKAPTQVSMKESSSKSTKVPTKIPNKSTKAPTQVSTKESSFTSTKVPTKIPKTSTKAPTQVSTKTVAPSNSTKAPTQLSTKVEESSSTILSFTNDLKHGSLRAPTIFVSSSIVSVDGMNEILDEGI